MLVVVLGGCTVVDDDELTPTAPTTSVRTTPSERPVRLPVGEGPVQPADTVWAQGPQLHVRRTQIDLTPLRVDALVAVTGGIFFLNRGELWFTDLRRARATGLTKVRALERADDGTQLLVVRGSGDSEQRTAYDLGTGRQVSPVRPSRFRQARLGRPAAVQLLGSSVTVQENPRDAKPTGWLGPGDFGVLAQDARFVAFRDESREVVPVKFPYPGFRLVAWTGPNSVFGAGVRDGAVVAAVSCDLAAGSCQVLGKDDSGGLVLGDGNLAAEPAPGRG